MKAGVYHRLRRAGVNVITLVYDILPLTLPSKFPKGTAQAHELWVENVFRLDGVVCISRTVMDELTEWAHKKISIDLNQFSINWFHLGADIENSSPSTGFPGNYASVIDAIKRKTSFLMVGTLEPRKGHSQTLAAFEQMWAGGVHANLIIVGKQGWKVDKLAAKLRNHPELGKRLYWMEGISDEYLEQVYAASSCLIAASEGEGFGLPLIEAAQHGLPMIARDILVFREVAGEYAFYFDGKEPAELAAAIQDWLKLYKSNQHPGSDSMPWLTWKDSVAQLLERLGVTTLEMNKDIKIL